MASFETIIVLDFFHYQLSTQRQRKRTVVLGLSNTVNNFSSDMLGNMEKKNLKTQSSHSSAHPMLTVYVREYHLQAHF